MITLPVAHPRSTAPPARAGGTRGQRPPGDAAEAHGDGAAHEPGLDDSLRAQVDRTVAEALARVAGSGDAEVAAQKAAFDRLLARQAEQLRESNAIRELMAKQLERENEFLRDYIRTI